MKQLRIILALVLTVAALTLISACAGESSLIGSWKTSAYVIGIETTAEESGNYYLCYVFVDATTGKQQLFSGETMTENPFTYSIADGNLTLTFDSEKTAVYQYTLKGDSLTLTFNGQDGVFTRESGK